MEILGRYRITYANGMTQEKNLIEHKDYLEVIKPLLSQDTDKKQEKGKKEVKRRFGEAWFTNQSPMYEAMSAGVLKHYGGETNIKFEQV